MAKTDQQPKRKGASKDGETPAGKRNKKQTKRVKPELDAKKTIDTGKTNPYKAKKHYIVHTLCTGESFHSAALLL